MFVSGPGGFCILAEGEGTGKRGTAGEKNSSGCPCQPRKTQTTVIRYRQECCHSEERSDEESLFAFAGWLGPYVEILRPSWSDGLPSRLRTSRMTSVAVTQTENASRPLLVLCGGEVDFEEEKGFVI